MSNKLEGTVCFMGETKTYGQSGFRKREIVLSLEDGQYENFIPMQLVQDKCDVVESMDLTVGSIVLAEYSMRGRKWRSPEGEDKYFLDLEVLGITRLNEAVVAGSDIDESVQDGHDVSEDEPF